MVKYFYAETSPSKIDKKYIKMDFTKFPENIRTEGSYAILPARLLGLSYADYCRLCRDAFDGEIIGKGTMYPVCYFSRDKGLILLLELLNKRMELVMKVIESSEKEYFDEMIAEYKRAIKNEDE